jgi:S-DNA-T family DNA segregation ATPase FtsK/SpoIIIE
MEEPTAESNKLKQKGKRVTVMMPKQEEPTTDPMNEMSLVEREELGFKDNDYADGKTDVANRVNGEAFIPFEINQSALTINDLYADKGLNFEEQDDEAAVSPEEADVPIDELPTFYEPTPKKNTVSLEVKRPTIDAPALEIKEALDNETAEESIAAAAMAEMPMPKTDYDPLLDLRDYKYPTLDLLEAHGSEKIVHDTEELEANKNQIIETLKNYDIDIQRIAATVGPTVTLYEIVPAPGVRISRIKNLEDDIALSLAALGIRIIAPIPGKGTIGIEVPNVRKTVVSMKTLLASEKFQNNNYSLPIAIGKK